MLVAIPFGNGYFVNENGEVFSYKNDGLKKLKPITNWHKGYAACGGELEVVKDVAD